MTASASYNPRACCNADCTMLDVDDAEPCWGDVEVIDEDWCDEDWWWVHACQGHLRCRRDGVYVAEQLA